MLAPVATDLLLIGIFVMIVGWVYGVFRRHVLVEHTQPPTSAHAAACSGRFVYRDKFFQQHDLRL
ncbi:MAG TPA: hypothetical protein VHS97_17150 [Isosphaeraceae bacterium]|nr:hypothetical protein [Isosphaeraceae bacterium]